MAITLNGSTGIQTVLGSAAAPAESNTSSSNTGLYFPTSTTLGLSTNGTNALYVDASQNVGIGTSSPSTKLTIGGTAAGAGASGGLGVFLSRGVTTNFYEAYDGTKSFIAGVDNTLGYAKVGTLSSHPLALVVGNSTAAYIDTSGNVGIGETVPYGRLSVFTNSSNPVHFGNAANADRGGYLNSTGDQELMLSGGASYNSYSAPNFVMNAKTSGASGIYIGQSGGIGFWVNTGLTAGTTFNQSTKMLIDTSGNLLVGTTSYGPYTTRLTLKYAGTTIWSVGPNSTSDSFFVSSSASSTGVYLTASGTSWTSNSDERLKTDLEPIQNAVQKVSTLRSVTGRYIHDKTQTRKAFLIAQDVQKVLPEAVDATNPDNLGVAYTDVIPLLVAAITELKAEFDTYKASHS